MAAFALTPEQSDINDAFSSGTRMVIKALAGTGKTTTLKSIADGHPELRFTYSAFNRAIADEAQRKFPRNVVAKTMHSFAYASVGQKFSERLAQGRVPAWEVVKILGIPSGGYKFGKFSLRDNQVARLVNESVSRFCHSTLEVPDLACIPKVPGMDTLAARNELNSFLLPFVQRAWDDLTDPSGKLKFTHDVYLKIWAMGDPRLPGDVILFDEAQDADPVIVSVVRYNMDRGMRVVPVGDENQQIYGWRGAVDALGQFDHEIELPLQKSFRFGPEIAERANLLLDVLGTDLRLEGHEPVGSRLAVLDDPDVVLCRSNSETVSQLLAAQARGIKAGLVGGTGAVESLAKAAQDLMDGKRTWHPDLMAFESWTQVREYVRDYPNESQDIAVLVRLVDTHGPEVMLRVAAAAVPEDQAELVISTAHKAKGREWGYVRVANDFTDPRDELGSWNLSEVRLQYVTLTRAMGLLDDLAMPWLDELAGVPADRLAADEVVPRIVEEIPVAKPLPSEQVICDPESGGLIMCRTKYDRELVAAQQQLPGRRFRKEYAGLANVNVVAATRAALAVAAQWRLTVSDEARARVEAADPA